MELMVIVGAFIVGGLFGIVLICTLMSFDDYDVARENFQTGKEIGYRQGYEEARKEAQKEEAGDKMVLRINPPTICTYCQWYSIECQKCSYPFGESSLTLQEQKKERDSYCEEAAGMRDDDFRDLKEEMEVNLRMEGWKA